MYNENVMQVCEEWKLGTKKMTILELEWLAVHDIDRMSQIITTLFWVAVTSLPSVS